jgi:hypothetical protein
MIREFEYYHGVAIRDIIVCRRPQRVSLRLADSRGRLNSYVLDDELGLHIKHSSARMPPWQFGFGQDTLLELDDLRDSVRAIWLAFVCGEDGVVFLPESDLLAVNPSSSGAYLRIDRDKRAMYRINGSGGPLRKAVRRGALPLVSDLSSDSRQ